MAEDRPGRVVLASRSPRRVALLRRLGIVPHVQPTDVDESPLAGEAPEVLAVRLARAKRDAAPVGPGDLVVGADTVVVLDGRSLGKPGDDDEAARTLAALSGRAHDVVTGVAVACDGCAAAVTVTTRVWFVPLSPADITAYVASGEPRDKAGAYGLQGAAAAFVTRIEGSHTNVIGLPLAEVVALAREVGAAHLLGVASGPVPSGPPRPPPSSASGA